MKQIKKIAALAFVALTAACPSWALTEKTELNAATTISTADDDDVLQFTSTATGLSFVVPANIKEKQDDVEAIVLVTPDNMFTVTAVPFDISTVEDGNMEASILTLAKAAKIDLTESESIEGETETVHFYAESADYANGGGAAVGIANVKGTDLSFFITVVASKDYIPFAIAALKSLSFNPDAIED